MTRYAGRMGGFSLFSRSGKQNSSLLKPLQSSQLGSVAQKRNNPIIGFHHFFRLLRISSFFFTTMFLGPKVETILEILPSACLASNCRPDVM